MALRVLGALPFALVLLASLCSVSAADVYQGCYRAYDYGERPLEFLAATASTMSQALCSAMAKRRFATAYGLEYGVECWLDTEQKSLADLTSLGPSDSCVFPCAGDRSSKCGGRYAMNMYTRDPVERELNLPESGWTDVGCYRDSHWFRYMPKLLWKSRTAMSTELCAHIAYSEHWPLFALQYGVECWGADDLHLAGSGGELTSGCDMPCPGNTNQTCGGSWSLQVYQFNTPPPADTTHAGTTPPPASVPYDPEDATAGPAGGSSSSSVDGQMGTMLVDTAAGLLLGGTAGLNVSPGQVAGNQTGQDVSRAGVTEMSALLVTVMLSLTVVISVLGSAM